MNAPDERVTSPAPGPCATAPGLWPNQQMHAGLAATGIRAMEAEGPELETGFFNRNMNRAATAQRQRGRVRRLERLYSPSSATDIWREAIAAWRFRLSARLKMPFGA